MNNSDVLRGERKSLTLGVVRKLKDKANCLTAIVKVGHPAISDRRSYMHGVNFQFAKKRGIERQRDGLRREQRKPVGYIRAHGCHTGGCWWILTTCRKRQDEENDEGNLCNHMVSVCVSQREVADEMRMRSSAHWSAARRSSSMISVSESFFSYDRYGRSSAHLDQCSTLRWSSDILYRSKPRQRMDFTLACLIMMTA